VSAQRRLRAGEADVLPGTSEPGGADCGVSREGSSGKGKRKCHEPDEAAEEGQEACPGECSSRRSLGKAFSGESSRRAHGKGPAADEDSPGAEDGNDGEGVEGNPQGALQGALDLWCMREALLRWVQ